MSRLQTRLRLLLPTFQPLRRPTTNHPPPIRLFTSRPPHLSLARAPARPSLPFLHSARQPRVHRLLSTEQTAQIKYSIKLGIYWAIIGWIVLFSGSLCCWVLYEDLLDRSYPSPEEWRYLVKVYWRSAKDELETEGHGRGMVDWTRVGTNFRTVVGLLEDYKFFVHRPSRCVLQERVFDRTLPFADDEGLWEPVPLAPRGEALWPSRIGYDISMQSEAWRRGYFEAMMGMAKGAEMRDGYMTHTKDRKAYAPQHIRSETNPFPVPLPPGAGHETPDIEDCAPTLESPDFHYKRILTTKGFGTRQRMQAGIAYGSWLDHCGDREMAEKMYRWNLAMATKDLQKEVAVDQVINTKTGVVKSDAPIVTRNVLEATEAFARHQAQHGRIPEALAIYLSLLRARRSAPDAPLSQQYPAKNPEMSLRSVDSAVRWILSLPFSPEHPPPPPTGDEVFERRKSDECEEAALALYVSEILFARMGRKREGLAWTQDATEAAERRQSDQKLDAKGRKMCEQCVHTGLQNWTNMVGQLAQEQKEKGSQVSDAEKQVAPKTESWFWRGLETVGIGPNTDGRLLKEQDWENERKQLQYRLAQFEEGMLNARLNAMIAGNSSWFVV